MHSQTKSIVESPLQLIVYVSAATEHFSEAALESLLTISRRRNADVGITGVLLYVEGSIIQAFEGPSSAVVELDARISKDPRHRGLIYLLRQSVQHRTFPDWTMGLVRSSREQLGYVEGLNRYLDRNSDLSEIEHRQVLILLNQFVRASLGNAA